MRTIRPLLFLITIAALIAACGGASSGAMAPGGDTAIPGGGKALGGGAEGAPPANPAPPNGLGGGQIAAVDDAKIIRTGTMSLEVSDVATPCESRATRSSGSAAMSARRTRAMTVTSRRPRSRTGSPLTDGRTHSTSFAASTG